MGVCSGKTTGKENLVTDIDSLPIQTQGNLDFNIKI